MAQPKRQVISVGDTATAAATAKVTNADPGSTDYGIATRDVRGNLALPVRVDPTGTTVQPVSLATMPSTPVTSAGLTNLDVALSTRTKPSDQQHTIVDSGTLTAVTSITNPVAVTLAVAPSTPVTGPLTDTQLRATTVPVSVSGNSDGSNGGRYKESDFDPDLFINEILN